MIVIICHCEETPSLFLRRSNLLILVTLSEKSILFLFMQHSHTVYVDELDESFINSEWLHLTDDDKKFIEEVKQKIANGEELDYE